MTCPSCPSCAHENRPGARFCEECAAPLARVCANCGAELRPTAKFCDECATPVAGAAPAARPAEPADTRKVVTIIFADLAGSTAMQERLDAESVRLFMESYYQAMRDAVESHGGTVTQFLGDGVKAVFGIPRVAEDDAIRAVRAAAAMQKSFRALADEQRGAVGATGLRVAVNTGEVVANDETEIIGDPVNVAARLQEQGQDGDVVVGESTRQLVSALVTLELLGKFTLKGRSEAVEAYRVVSLDRPAGAAAAPFVGREEELARLVAVYDTAVEKPAAGLAVLVGSPGLGKSRLIDEFAQRHADVATVVHAHCDAEGGASFAPLSVAIRELLGIEGGADADTLRAAVEAAMPGEDSDRARIASGIAALLAGSPASPEETFFVVRRMLGALAHKEPVVLVIDDLQWAESLLLDLVEHLIQWGSGTPLFVLIGARPELRELRSSLVTPGGLVSEVVTLGGLDAGAAMRLAASVIGANDLPAAVAAKVLATSEGNPLFVSELVRMLVQEGALTKEGERWTVGANLAALEMPPTIHALLAARIERLRPEERTLLERAAVVGRNFSRNAVAALLPREANDLDARLEALQRSELIERDSGWLLGEPALRFHHVLIRDAAYRRLLKGTRAELHAKLADWIEAQVGDAPEHDETIGWHLEQAHAFLCELGPLDAIAKRLGERAAVRLSAAGRRALAGDDVPLAASLLGRAIERLDVEDPARADLALDWCEALLSAGEVGPASAAIAELGRFAADSDRLSAWQSCFASQLTVLTAPQELQAAADAVSEAAQQLTELGDAAGEAKAHSVHAQALARLGKVGACEAALDLALAAARRAGDRRRANAVLAGAPLAALWGPSPVTRASGRCLDVVRVLRITQGAPAVESVALSCQGVLEALRGRTDAARRMIASSRKMVEELGIANRLFEADVFAARIEAMEGDTAAAERLLSGAYDGLRDLGLGIDAAIAGSLLAQTLLAQDRVAEAEALSHESEVLAGDDLQAAIAWRGVRAEALAKRGEHAAAIEFAKAAVAIASATDALLYHADARMALAAALRAAGRNAEAEAEERRAIDIWEAKGATLLVERARDGALHGKEVGGESVQPVAASPALRRPIRPNAASEANARFETTYAARDFAGLRSLCSEDFEVIDHPTGLTYQRDGAIASIERVMQSNDVIRKIEPLATLGESLLLFRRHFSASGTGSRHFDVGAYESDAIAVRELDERGRFRVQEDFAHDRLGEAISCLYERHADLLPEGPERERAEATARSVGVVAPGGFDLDRYTEAFRSDAEIVDHRLLGSGSATGPDQMFRMIAQAREVGIDVEAGAQDVLALTHDALLLSWLTSGAGRESGGAFEWAFIRLFVFDAEGRVARYELFDEGSEAEALARFDELVGTETQIPVRHPVRENAATRSFERFGAALVARDAEALTQLIDESLQVVHHPSGTTYGRREMLITWRSGVRAARFDYEREIVASLGEALALEQHVTTIEGLTEVHLAGFGLTEIDEFALLETDARGLCIHIELFAPDQLGKAIARLYERYADLLPEGPEREHAAGVARTMASLMRSAGDPDLMASVVAPDFEGVDHRHLSLWSVRGAETYLNHLRAHREVADNVTFRHSEILALAPNAQLSRVMNSGTDRRFGGAYERPFLSIILTDAKGRLARMEWFADDREAEALARFDELVAETEPKPSGRRPTRANAASVADTRMTAAVASRDLVALEAILGEHLEATDHRWHTSYGRDGVLETCRRFMQPQDADFRSEPIATLGKWLSLGRDSIRASGASAGHFDVGEHATEFLHLLGVDQSGRVQNLEFFATDHLTDAVMRLYERHAELLPEGPERLRAAATARAVAVWCGPIDVDRLATALSPSVENIDHRKFGTWSARGAEEFLQHWREQLELTIGFAHRAEVILAIASNAFLSRRTYFGTGRDTGGTFENVVLALWVFGSDGLLTSVEVWEPEDEATALAHFDALVENDASKATRERFENAASRAYRKLFDHFNSRNWVGIEDLAAPNLVFDERRRMLHNTCGREIWLEQFRVMFDVPESHFKTQLLATRGERLSLSLHQFAGMVAGGGGPLQMDDHFVVHEVDGEGRIVAIVLFDLEAEEAAYAELDARFEAGVASANPHLTHLVETLRATQLVQAQDWQRLADKHAPGFVYQDHRRLGWGTVPDIESFVRVVQSAFELAPDAQYRQDHARIAARGVLRQTTLHGTRDGGAFENPLFVVYEADEQGLIARADSYDIEDLDRALARFAELSDPAPAEPPAELVKPNAASRWLPRFQAVFDMRDWDAIRDLYTVDVSYEDRQRFSLVSGGSDMILSSVRERAQSGASLERIELISTIGDRIAIQRSLWAGGGIEDRFEMEFLILQEVNEEGRLVATINFDMDDTQTALREAWVRWAASDPVASPIAERLTEITDAWNERDEDRVRMCLADDLVVEDHRLAGFGRLEGADAYVNSNLALWDLAPDQRLELPRFVHAFRANGTLAFVRRMGTILDGGAFESVYLWIGIMQGNRFAHIELFEIDALDEALARFQTLSEELTS